MTWLSKSGSPAQVRSPSLTISGIRTGYAVVLGRAIEKRAGDLSGRIAGLSGSIVELCELKVADAILTGKGVEVPSVDSTDPLLSRTLQIP